MVALRASRPAFLFPYTSQIHARSVAHTPFQTVSSRSSQKFLLSEVGIPLSRGPRGQGSPRWASSLGARLRRRG